MRDNLYFLRCKHKLTKGEMAKRTGVSRATYSYIENGDRDGSHAFWQTLQQEFSVPDEQMYSLMLINEKRG